MAIIPLFPPKKWEHASSDHDTLQLYARIAIMVFDLHHPVRPIITSCPLQMVEEKKLELHDVASIIT